MKNSVQQLKRPEERKSDFNLMTARLKQMALRGDNPDKCVSTLENNAIRERLDPDQLRQWSEAAMIMGRVDLALDILSWTNEHHPGDALAWKDRYELLQRLNRLDQAEAVRAKAVLTHPGLKEKLEPARPTSQDEPGQEIGEPFTRFREHQELHELFLDYFQGREDVFARQWADKAKDTQGYVPVRRPITLEDIVDHIKGRRTYGIYLLREDSTVKAAVIDMDLNKSLRMGPLKSTDKLNIKRERDYVFSRMDEMCRERINFTPLCEFSGGKGYHFWFFFEGPVPADQARKLITPIAAALARDCQCFNLEVFPKQDRLQGKGLGNLVKLPLGIHRVSGKPSYFVGSPRNDPMTNLGRIRNHARITGREIDSAGLKDRESSVILHPGYREWAEKYPELHLLVENCPPMGRIITALRGAKELGIREERVLFQTLGFLSRASLLLHYLLKEIPEYNPHLVDYKLSRLRGTPLGCKKIHQLLNINLDFCDFDDPAPYAHPLLHCRNHFPDDHARSEKIENLSDALDNLRAGLDIVRRFMPRGRE